MKKKIVSVIIAVAFFLNVLPGVAHANSGTISANGIYDISSFGNDSVISIDPNLSVELTNSGGLAYTNIQIVCSPGVSLALNHVLIDNKANAGICALSFSGENNQLFLEGMSTVQSGENQPGVKVEEGATLTIAGTGSLFASGGAGGAGFNGGSIAVSGGVVFAQKGENGSADIAGSLTFSGDAAIFLKNGECAAPATEAHALKTFDAVTGNSVYGFSVPDGWSAPIFAYLNENNLFGLAYDPNGGEGTPPGSVTQYKDKSAPVIVADGNGFTKDGQAFKGWNTAADGTGEAVVPGSEYTLTQDMTLYAQYETEDTKDINAAESNIILSPEAYAWPSGSGTAEDPYLVSTPEQLNEVRNYPDACFLMINDIDMSAATTEGGAYYNEGKGWAPIATFNGEFDGGGYKIVGLNINRPDENYVGFIDQIYAGAEVHHIGMVDSAIYGGLRYTGGICARNFGTIEYSFHTGFVKGSENAITGGIAGIVSDNGTIHKSYNSGHIVAISVSGYTSSNGGIAGIFYHITGVAVSDCYNTGFIDGGTFIGGIVGDNSAYSASVQNCYNVGCAAQPITGRYSADGGGLYYYKQNGNGNISGQTALTNEEMVLSSSFIEYDFENVWTMENDLSYPYPELLGVEQPAIQQNTTDFAGGNGLPYSPFEVKTPEQFNNIRNFTWACFILKNNIDMADATSEGGAYYNEGKGWDPIENLQGELNGNGFEIIGLKINRPQEAAGLFFRIDSGAAVYNLGMTDSYIYGGADRNGSVCALNLGTIGYCYTTGNVFGGKTGETGGIAGGMMYDGLISNCYNIAAVRAYSANLSGQGALGGIVGDAYYNGGGTIINCFNAGPVEGLDYVDAGGIAGDGGFGVYNCYNVGSVSDSPLIGFLSSPSENAGLYFYSADNNGNGTCGTALTNEQMQNPSSFAEFDFVNMWTMGDASYPYPILQGLKQVSFPQNTVDFAGGNGYPYSPFQIKTPEQLNNIRNFPWGCFTLKNDLDLSYATDSGGPFNNNGKGWDPIDYFIGEFSGGGYSINRLTINRSDEDLVGLFSKTMQGSYIHDLALKNVNVSGYQDTGSLVGFNQGVLKGISAHGQVQSVSLCVGGITGDNYGLITLCRNVCRVSIAGYYAGGIAGRNHGVIEKCYNTGFITGGSVGGIAGDSENTINNCYNLGTVKLEGVINGSLGGIAGNNQGNIENCYNAGELYLVSNSHLGGIAGSNYDTISNCYFENTIEKGIGLDSSSSVSATFPKTADELKQQATFTGFDFNAIWSINENISNPYLRGFAASTDVIISSRSETVFIKNKIMLNATVLTSDGTSPVVTWSTSDGSVATVSDQGEITAVKKGNAIITASADGVQDTCVITVLPETVTVTFNSQSGSPVASQTIAYNTLLNKPGNPARKGYAFSGWYKDTGCTNVWNFTGDKVTDDTTLYAKWTATEKYTVTFNSQGGSTVSGVQANYDSTITQPTAPQKSGYMFGGWYKETGCMNRWNFMSDTVTGNITLYAKWIDIVPTMVSLTPAKDTVFSADSFVIRAYGVADPAGVKNVSFAVYREADGPENYILFAATDFGNGLWAREIPLRSLGGKYGKYMINVYGTDGNDNWSFMGQTSVVLQADVKQPTAGSITPAANTQTTDTTVVLRAYGVSDPSGVKSVQFAVYREADGAAKYMLFGAADFGNGLWAREINLSALGGNNGKYIINVYGTDAKDNWGFMGQTSVNLHADDKAPALTSITPAANTKLTDTTVVLRAIGVSDPSGVKSVQFAVYREADGDAKYMLFSAADYGKGLWAREISLSALGGKNGKYIINVYGTDAKGNWGFMGQTSVNLQADDKAPTLSSITPAANTQLANTTVVLRAYGVTDPSGVKSLQFAVYREADGQAKYVLYSAENYGSGLWAMEINLSALGGKSGRYIINVYGTDSKGNWGYMGYTNVALNTTSAK